VFLPNQTARQGWISRSILGNILRHPDFVQPKQTIVRCSDRDRTRARGLALATGLAILLLVLALILLMTSPTADTPAAVAAPPVFDGAAREEISSR